jgi:hypothetical protein
MTASPDKRLTQMRDFYAYAFLLAQIPEFAGTLASARSADRPPRTSRDDKTRPAAETPGWLPGALRSDTHRCGAMGI